jgi:hypothetical protein
MTVIQEIPYITLGIKAIMNNKSKRERTKEIGTAVRYNPGIHFEALRKTTISSVRIAGHSTKI